MTAISVEELLEGRERFLAFLRRELGDPELAEDILQDSYLKARRGSTHTLVLSHP